MKSFVETLANVVTVVACFVIVIVAFPQLKQRWQGLSGATAMRLEPVEHVSNLSMTMPKLAVRGSQDANVAFIEFSDFQCPYCGLYARGTSGEIQKEFVDTGKVIYGFRNFPLTQIHPFARKAGQAALCAGDQQRFWPMHDQLFRDQKALAVQDLLRYADELGLDRNRFTKCFDDSNDVLVEDITEATRASVNSTPTFLVGTVESEGTVRVLTKINGAGPMSAFRAAIEEALLTPANAGL